MSIREEMFRQLEEKEILENAKSFAYEYLDNMHQRNVFPTDEALKQLKHFDEDLPQHTREPEEVISLLHTYGSPATTTNTGGRYFGLVNGSTIPASLASKWLTDVWDQNAVLYVTSPISSKLEEVTEKWLRQLFNLPESTVAGFVSGTSLAIFSGLVAARWRICQRQGYDINAGGLKDAPPIRIVTGKHTHGSVIKAIALLGLGYDNIEWVDVDEQGRIIPDKIPQLDATCMLILQAGNVNSGSFDDFEAIFNQIEGTDAWVHIDGAFGLWAAGCKTLSHLTKGIEKGDSWSVDGHKTLNTPYDNGIVLCKDREALVSALQNTGSYIVFSENRDGMLYTPDMSRRARVIELWASLKYLGADGVDELVRGLHERAVRFSEEISQVEGFQVLNDVVFNQVIVRCESDELTLKTMEAMQKSLECWCGGAKWFGQQVIRVSVCSWATTPEDITRSVRAFEQAHLAVQ